MNHDVSDMCSGEFPVLSSLVRTRLEELLEEAFDNASYVLGDEPMSESLEALIRAEVFYAIVSEVHRL